MQLISDWSLVFNRTRLLRIIKVTVPRRHFRLATTYARKVARDKRWPNFQDCVSKSNFYSKSMKRKSLTNNLSQWTKYCKINIPVLKPLSFATFFFCKFVSFGVFLTLVPSTISAPRPRHLSTRMALGTNLHQTP